MAWSRWRARWKRPDGAPVSMTLTSTLLRRRASRRNPRIPTIPAGRFHGETVDVSAVGSSPRAPMWCVKRRWVAVSMAVGCRGGCCGSWCAGSGCGGGPGRAVNRLGFDGGSDDTEGSLSWDRRSTPMNCGGGPRGWSWMHWPIRREPRVRCAGSPRIWAFTPRLYGPGSRRPRSTWSEAGNHHR